MTPSETFREGLMCNIDLVCNVFEIVLTWHLEIAVLGGDDERLVLLGCQAEWIESIAIPRLHALHVHREVAIGA